jgi:hypothetical protein
MEKKFLSTQYEAKYIKETLVERLNSERPWDMKHRQKSTFHSIMNHEEFNNLTQLAGGDLDRYWKWYLRLKID